MQHKSFVLRLKEVKEISYKETEERKIYNK